jgi:dienelactone hydrolase
MEFHEQITIGIVFLVFAYFAGLGFWQIVAAWQGLRAFSWLPRGAKDRWGYLTGSLVVVLACVWFFGTRTDDIFCPGPASSEFLFFLAVGLLLSLATSVVISTLVDGIAQRRAGSSGRRAARGEAVAATRWQGALYMPSSGEGPWSGVCIVPEPGMEVEPLKDLAARLARKGTVALVLDMGSREKWKYPDVLATIPLALDYLEAIESVGGDRLGLLGVGIGADLALRAAASDPQVGAVVAVAPLLWSSTVKPGLDLLREMTYLGAIRWRRRLGGGALVAQLDALAHIAELAARPLLVIYGANDRLAAGLDTVEWPGSAKRKKVSAFGRVGLVADSTVVSSTAGWLSRQLEGAP